MQKRGFFARKQYKKAPKNEIRVKPRFCSKITLSPSFPTSKSRFLRAFLEVSQKSVIFLDKFFSQYYNSITTECIERRSYTFFLGVRYIVQILNVVVDTSKNKLSVMIL